MLRELKEDLAMGASAEDAVAALFGKIKRSRLNAYNVLSEDLALERARDFDRSPWSGLMAGVPIAIKSCISTRGIETNCSSRILSGYTPPYDATVIERLKEEGAIIVGKTNMDEFAMGTSTETSYFGPTRNPWDLDRVPGGSSGGSAAAVAAGEAPAALGSDTGGSIRCPASFCGIVGLKPTYGLVSRYGLVSYANSLEQIGPLALTVEDAALVLDVIAGHDPRDSTSADTPGGYLSALDRGVDGLTLGVPEEYFGEGVNPKVERSVWDAISKLEELGASWKEVSLPHTKYALAAYYIIAMSEASSNLARFDGLRYGLRLGADQDWHTTFSDIRAAGFGPEVKRRVLLGTYALSAGYYGRYYLKALKVRTLIKEDFERALSVGGADLLVTPTMPFPAFKIGERIEDPLSLYMADVFTVPINLAGVPAISVPCGFADGLPIGLQIIGRHFDEVSVLRAAKAYEDATPYHEAVPKEVV
ncbi:MAG: Asp-tRNA(Asn)/Glu-tRNA(Gln) amidotransferase subunit GatA [Methanothrix sp.]|jgi:aspartyl-tRNA(Asn)/glutamyl-tRNA(Gln) amidotransferase subunit A|nr:Asp-tRNA(Asn)/Glu-tRNA(Gln) amidotransferase subunit GatA [Methanothrix sp.]OPX81209.1 MAG: Amidase [Methanosaeta sp. PtaB.Bin087]NLX39708.1 Asp-tRNA(Asn)/Glu-tRNA(Gln) amidotransferase subunit GatA [Methanothrix sp.]HNR58135.1 Asp-tRNA(Asn)/Glu-tRNA(Gln) amidotransferase subunit GatA [Methanothrix sp.]HNT71730.1 Asp-tRNA(Asn)/Glu-tRNA(Gln) amidotransferase subunit GatA [Methanothrix sp.]